MLTFLLLGALSLSSLNAFGYSNYCHESFNGPVKSICPGRMLPASKVRNFHRNSHDMLCTGNVDHYIRSPQKYDFNEWETKRQAGQTQEAFEMRRKLPEIKWSGRIPYETIEAWTWEECALGTNGPICGYDKQCHNVSHTVKDANGNMHTETEKVCVDVPKTCWYDQNRYEEWHCTNEIMTYSAQYIRPDESQWNIKNNELSAEFLPNKYDLLPGEVEDVQVFNNGMKSTVLRPYIVIGDAWNKYDTSGMRGTGVNASCVPNRDYHIDIPIVTVERDRTKSSPNAFRLPEDNSGIELIEWDIKEVDGKQVRVKPQKIRLQDVSSAVVSAVSSHSLKNSDREKAKAEAGIEGNSDKITKKDYNSFFKNNVIRVQAYKINAFWFDELATNYAYADDSQSIKPSLNILSTNQEIALADLWEVDLDTKDSTKSNLYRLKYLRPNRNYVLYVSMYQKGVPFYQQSCEYNPEQKGCGLGWWIPFYGLREDDYFSKPLKIKISTDPGYDDRSIFQRFSDFSLWELLVHSRVEKSGDAR